MTAELDADARTSRAVATAQASGVEPDDEERRVTLRIPRAGLIVPLLALAIYAVLHGAPWSNAPGFAHVEASPRAGPAPDITAGPDEPDLEVAQDEREQVPDLTVAVPLDPEAAPTPPQAAGARPVPALDTAPGPEPLERDPARRHGAARPYQPLLD